MFPFISHNISKIEEKFQINLALFINLVRVVVVKLWLSNNNLYNHYMKRHHFVKTALILMPIFGLQYFIHIIPPGDPTETCDNIQIGLLYLQLIIESAQGILVTITLCFLNKEVCFTYIFQFYFIIFILYF